MGAKYTKEMDDYIIENFNDFDALDFMLEFNRKFKEGRTINALNNRACLLGIARTQKVFNENKSFDIEDVKRRAIGININGYKLIKFYPNYALYEKVYPTGERVKTTYSYYDLNQIV